MQAYEKHSTSAIVLKPGLYASMFTLDKEICGKPNTVLATCFRQFAGTPVT